MSEVVELPESLAECGCENASWGNHKTSCEPARLYCAGFDAASRQRYGAEEKVDPSAEPEWFRVGWDHRMSMPKDASWHPVTWKYPWTISSQVDVEIDLDPALYIAARLDKYIKFTFEPEWEDDQKPVAFLAAETEEACWMSGFGNGRDRASHDRSRYSDWDFELSSRAGRWTEDDTLTLHATLGLNAEGTARVEPPEPAPSLFDAGAQS